MSSITGSSSATALILLLLSLSSISSQLAEANSRKVRQVALPEQPPAASQNPLNFLSNLGPQLEKAQSSMNMFSSLFSTNQQQPASQQVSAALSQALGQTAAPSTGQLMMNQLSELVKSTQERNAKLVANTQQVAQQAGQEANQQVAAAAQNAQGGIQSALSEIGSGLQRIASNNPNLLPDVKSLYQSVSSKLSSASSSVAQSVTPANLIAAPIASL